MAVESGKEFIQHHHHQLVSLMGIQYKSLSLHLDAVWPARRSSQDDDQRRDFDCYNRFIGHRYLLRIPINCDLCAPESALILIEYQYKRRLSFCTPWEPRIGRDFCAYLCRLARRVGAFHLLLHHRLGAVPNSCIYFFDKQLPLNWTRIIIHTKDYLWNYLRRRTKDKDLQTHTRPCGYLFSGAFSLNGIGFLHLEELILEMLFSQRTHQWSSRDGNLWEFANRKSLLVSYFCIVVERFLINPSTTTKFNSVLF